MHYSLFHRLAQGVLPSEELPSEIGLGELSSLMSELWRLLIANLELCERLGLAFYYGRIPGVLKEVFRP